jgi:hypothetical protein
MTKYRSIVFMHDYQDETFAGLLEDYRNFEDGSLEALVEYLAQWDMDGEGDINDEPSAGTTDCTVERYGYVLTVNHRLGYAGLEAIETE